MHRIRIPSWRRDRGGPLLGGHGDDPRLRVVIEFVGRAGVGKTTIARQLVRELELPGLETELLAERGIPLLQRFSPRDLVLACRLALALRLPVNPTTISRTVGVYKEFVKLRYAERAGGTEGPMCCVFDQGVFQRLEMLAKLRPPDERRTQAYLAVLKEAVLPDLVVLVRASAETMVERRSADNRGATTPDEERARAAASRTVEHIQGIAKQRSRHPIAVKVVVNEAPGDVIAIARELKSDMLEIASARAEDARRPSA